MEQLDKQRLGNTVCPNSAINGIHGESIAQSAIVFLNQNVLQDYIQGNPTNLQKMHFMPKLGGKLQAVRTQYSTCG